jgi:iron(III) transport system ATP-binding protein
MTEPAVRCQNLAKEFDLYPALNGLDLHVDPGEVLTVIGPSGCGKTTLLRLIAGFERPTSGRIILGGQEVAGPGRFIPPEHRGVGMVFQDFALFPHFTVEENVAFGLPQANGKRHDAVRSMLRLVGLERLRARYPHELSGGERQRVALARALTPRPILLLLDEPFSNLDADRRAQMREEVRAILTSTHSTAIFVTHDQEEALFMGDRLAVLRDGLLEQAGTPEDIFHRPQTRFVAEFMGETYFLPGKVTAAGIETEIGLLRQSVNLAEGKSLDVAFRADDVYLKADPTGEALVLARHFKGAHNLYRVRLPSGRLIRAARPHTDVLKPGTRVQVRAAPGHPLACFLGGLAVNPPEGSGEAAGRG